MKPIIYLIIMLGVFSQFSISANRFNLNFDDEHITHEVYFDSDDFLLTTQESEKLKAFIKQIKNIDIERISILGYCDDIGTEIYNKELSDKRAEAIRQIIADFKIDDFLITNVNGEGELQLTTRERALYDKLRSLNRKVIIIVAPRKVIAGAFYEDDLYPGETFNIPNLKFKTSLRYLTQDSKKVLEQLANFLVNRKDIFFTVQGHVCCTTNGYDAKDKETNKDNLSVVRAKYIRDYLVNKGVEPFRIRYEGLAGRYKLGGNPKDDKRVEIFIRRIEGLGLSDVR